MYQNCFFYCISQRNNFGSTYLYTKIRTLSVYLFKLYNLTYISPCLVTYYVFFFSLSHPFRSPFTPSHILLFSLFVHFWPPPMSTHTMIGCSSQIVNHFSALEVLGVCVCCVCGGRFTMLFLGTGGFQGVLRSGIKKLISLWSVRQKGREMGGEREMREREVGEWMGRE